MSATTTERQKGAPQSPTSTESAAALGAAYRLLAEIAARAKADAD